MSVPAIDNLAWQSAALTDATISSASSQSSSTSGGARVVDVSPTHRTAHVRQQGACGSCKSSFPSLGAFVLAAINDALGGLFQLGRTNNQI
jgi:Fe-S cluster biogenesis protein NfuA